MSKTIQVDALGDQCPIPVVKAKKVLDHAVAGTVVEVHVDNEIAVQNLTRLARSQQCECRAEKLEEKHFTVAIAVPETAAASKAAVSKTAVPETAASKAVASEATVSETAASEAAAAKRGETGNPGISVEACYPDARNHSIVVVSSAVMGVGNDELGKVLMKGFIYAISQLDVLPEKMLFYNGGVTLTTEGSDSLEDLKAMEAQGVQIFSCGTCLNYYGLTDKLMVGEVTNMYSIVEAMASAAKIIRP